MLRTVFGSADIKASASKGRKSRTFSSPTFSPPATAFYGLLHCSCTRAHHHDHPFGSAHRHSRTGDSSGRSAGRSGPLRPARWLDTRDRKIDGLPRLEKDVGILRRTAQQRVIGRQCALAMLADQVIVDQRTQIVIGQQHRSFHFMGGAEAVEEMQKRNPRFQRGRLRNQGEVSRFLHGIGSTASQSRSRAPPSRRCGRRKSRVHASPERGRLREKLSA